MIGADHGINNILVVSFGVRITQKVDYLIIFFTKTMVITLLVLVEIKQLIAWMYLIMYFIKTILKLPIL